MAETPNAHVVVSTHDKITVLRIVPSRITEYEVAQGLGREMVAAVDQTDAEHVVVDMQDLVMMSSVGYGPFVDLRAHLAKKPDGRVFLCRMSETIRDVFTAARLLVNPRATQSRFESADTVEDAIQQLSTGD